MSISRQFTVAWATLAVASVGISLAGMLVLKEAWEPISYYAGRFFSENPSLIFPCLAFSFLVAPCLLTGLVLFLFRNRLRTPSSRTAATSPEAHDT